MMLPVVCYGCELWSLILRKKHVLKMLDSRLLRKIFEPNKQKVTGG
jgi:hypothetical protein